MAPKKQSRPAVPQQVERRRHPRCRFLSQFLSTERWLLCQATTSDISLCGLSAASTSVLRPGEEFGYSSCWEEISRDGAAQDWNNLRF